MPTAKRPPPSQSVRVEDKSLGKTLLFMQQLWELTHALDAMSKRMEGVYGVTGPQRLALRIIGRTPGIAAGALAETLRLHPSTLTGIVRRLSQRKLLKRTPDPADARRALLELLPAGHRLDEQRAHTVEAAVRRAMLRVTPTQLAAASAVIAVLISELARETEPS